MYYENNYENEVDEFGHDDDLSNSDQDNDYVCFNYEEDNNYYNYSNYDKSNHYNDNQNYDNNWINDDLDTGIIEDIITIPSSV